MKTIKNIDSRPTHFDEGVDQSTVPTYRNLLKGAIGICASNSPTEALDLYQIGMKLKLAESDISLEDAEFKLLKDKCDQNPSKWFSHIFAQVILFLREAE